MFRSGTFARSASTEVEQPPEPESTPSLTNEETSPPKRKVIGSHENGLSIISPRSNDCVIDLLHQVNHLMQERRTKARLITWIEDAKDDSARRIQGERLEIFLEATNKSSAAFDTILGERLPSGAKEAILNYARDQAQQDPRLHQGGMTYKFGNFSLICSYDVADAQAPHLDLIWPNFQFGLMVSDRSTSTLFYESDKHINTCDALVDQWQQMAEVAEGPNNPRKSRMTPGLIHALEREPAVRLLLECFGDVLLPARHVLYNMKKEPNLRTGSLLSLPGSVLHAAPAAASFRAVIFFSGWPGKGEIAEYNPDTQYTGVMLAGHITSLLWSRPGVGYRERLYLLRRLAQYVDGSTVPNMWGHFAPGNLADFVGNLEHRSRHRLLRDSYIEMIAKTSQDMGSPRDPFSDGHGDDNDDDDDADMPNLSDYELVSISDLYTLWDDEEYRVDVYRRISDGKIVIRYPSNGDSPDEFEGGTPAENFQLIMKEGYEQALFDGRNGMLLDTEGEGVDIYWGRGEDI